MDQERFQALCDAYFSGDLTAAEEAELQALLEADPACQKAFAEWQKLEAQLENLSPPPCPERLKERILSAVEAENPPARRWWHFLMAPAFRPAWALLVLAGAVFGVMQWKAEEPVPEAREFLSETAASKKPAKEKGPAPLADAAAPVPEKKRLAQARMERAVAMQSEIAPSPSPTQPIHLGRVMVIQSSERPQKEAVAFRSAMVMDEAESPGVTMGSNAAAPALSTPLEENRCQALARYLEQRGIEAQPVAEANRLNCRVSERNYADFVQALRGFPGFSGNVAFALAPNARKSFSTPAKPASIWTITIELSH